MTRPAWKTILRYAVIAVRDSADSQRGYDRQTAMHDVLNEFDGLTADDEELIHDAVCEAEKAYNKAFGVEL